MTDMYDRHQERALKANPGIPLLYGVDAVHGHNNVIGATVFPHNVGLGCTRNAKLVEQAARVTAEEVRATGMNWAFSPCVAVPQDIRWGRTYEGFSESPDLVKELGAAATRGLQRHSLADPLAVLACAKHFVADGATAFGTGQPKGRTGERFPLDQGESQIDEATLRRVHLQGYITAIRAGVGTVMPSYSSWDGEKCSGSKRLLTDMLKGELGFDGFLISDYAALNQLPGDYKQQIERSINAGMDMVMVPDKYVEFFETLKGLVQDGKVPQARIDDAVTRILRTKFALGLMKPRRNHLADRSLHRKFGSAEHRAVARQCVRESIVLLKNDNGVLPLNKRMAKLHVAGSAADDIGTQCGGWTITWQGKAAEITKGTTIVSAIRKAAGAGIAVGFTKDGSDAAGAGAAVVVVGETPYAEMNGDRTDLSLSAEDVALVRRVKQSGVPVVVLILSGRPVVIDEILGDADAVVAAWLPGTEGDGVADVLFGSYNPSGKLSFTWPSGKSTSMVRGDAGYKTLFPFGHGLRY
jgi:beta-glucosidase